MFKEDIFVVDVSTVEVTDTISRNVRHSSNSDTAQNPRRRETSTGTAVQP
jgi:hypothetical protein